MPIEPTPERDVRHGLGAWFRGARGAMLLDKESEFLVQGLRRFHGDSMLWLGPVALPSDDFERCMVRHRFFASPFPLTRGAVTFAAGKTGSAPLNACTVDLSELPFPPGSMDAVVVHHGLDCATDARTAMREVAKVLRPGGRLLLCGFNPYSFWGLRRWLSSWRDPQLSKARFVSPMRALDWLTVLGFEVDEGVHFLLFRPPLTQIDFDAPVWQHMHAALTRWRVPFGGVYFVLARKTSLTPTLRRDERSIRRAKLAPALPMPSARARHARQ